MNDSRDKWTKLAQWARQAPAQPLLAKPPLGFATRVVARWREGALPENGWVWELLSRRALAVAAAVMVISVGLNYDWFAESLTPEPAFSPGSLELFCQP